jgi:hypothetical protein
VSELRQSFGDDIIFPKELLGLIMMYNENTKRNARIAELSGFYNRRLYVMEEPACIQPTSTIHSSPINQSINQLSN